MIWQLLKRDPTWKALVPMAAVVALLVVATARFAHVPPRVHSREAFAATLDVFFWFCLVWMVCLGMLTQSTWTPHLAGLPVLRRDVWASRTLAQLAVFWLPSLTESALGVTPVAMLDAASVMTVMILAAGCAQVRELGNPQWLARRVFSAFFLLPLVPVFGRKYLDRVHWPALPSPAIVLPICALASMALVLFGLANIPKSFQVESLGKPRPRLDRETDMHGGFAWSTLIQSVCGVRQIALLSIFVVGYMATGARGAGIVAVIPLVSILGNCRWLLALPFPARKLFALIAILPTLATIAGYLANIFLHTRQPLTARASVVYLAAELTGVYLCMFIAGLSAWRGFSRLPVWLRWAPFAASFVAIPLAFADVSVFGSLTAMLPSVFWQLLAVLAIPIVASYWLAERVFAEREYRPRLIETATPSQPRA